VRQATSVAFGVCFGVFGADIYPQNMH